MFQQLLLPQWNKKIINNVGLIERFSISVLAPPPPPPRSAYFACLSLLTHLIQIISLLEVRSMHERLGYVCNPRSLKEGTETSRQRTDELGSRLERPIHFECKLNEPMHIGMRLLHPAAADHSVSINRQQVQRIFRFSLRSRAGARPLSGGTGAVSTSRRRTDELGSLPKGHGYCPFQCPMEASCAVIFWRRLGPP